MKNTSQDPDYVGPTGHEKRFHKTHFEVTRTLKKSKKKNDRMIWVKVGVGRYKLVNREEYEKEQKENE